MSTLLEQVYYMRLEPLTPIHIGSGAVLEPLEYVMREEDGAPHLYPIDLSAWVEAQANPLELANFFGSKPLPEIRRRIAKEIDLETFGGAPARVCSKEIFDAYQRELGDTRSENRLQISPALKNPHTGGLIIPGSSIKGAIRTAVIDWLDKEWGMGLKRASEEEARGQRRAYENKLEEYLGKISDNAFKNLKISDFQAGLGESLIFSAKEVRRRPSDKQSTPKNHCEVSYSRAESGSKYTLYGKLLLGAHSAEARDTALTIRHPQHGKRVWGVAELLELCLKHYGRHYLNEKKIFYGLPHLAATAEALRIAEQGFLEQQPNSALLRIGHYSHVECMTVSDNHPKTRKTKDGKIMPHGTTRTLANGVFPFGWARLSVCSEEEYREAIATREAKDQEFVQARERRLREVLETRERLASARAEAERRAEEERLAAEQAKAELASLSPEERLLLLLTRGQAKENQAVELFGKLDSFAPELAHSAAEALKAFWLAQNKWAKKQCTQKQWDKVLKIKTILGEA